jgi:hypothetical protein
MSHHRAYRYLGKSTESASLYAMISGQKNSKRIAYAIIARITT